MSLPLTLPRSHKLLKKADFDAVFAENKVGRCRLFVLYVLKNDKGHNRFGRIVSKKFGNAVARNRLRRMFLEAFRLLQHELPQGFDYLLLPLKVEGITMEVLKGELLKVARRFK